VFSYKCSPCQDYSGSTFFVVATLQFRDINLQFIFICLFVLSGAGAAFDFLSLRSIDIVGLSVRIGLVKCCRSSIWAGT
jgi:hypothetical protein